MGLHFWITFGVVAMMATPSLQTAPTIASNATSLSYLLGPVNPTSTYDDPNRGPRLPVPTSTEVDFVSAGAEPVDGQGSILATMFLPEIDGPEGQAFAFTESPSSTIPQLTEPPITTTPSSTKTPTTTPPAALFATTTVTTHSTSVTPTRSTPSTKSTGLASSQGSLTTPTIQSFPFPTDIQTIILATKTTEDALTPTRIVVSTSSIIIQMSILSTASSTPAAALASMEVKTNLSATSRGTSATTFSSNTAKESAASPSTPSLSGTSTSNTSTKTTSTRNISSAKSNNPSTSPSSTTQMQGEWKPMMQTTLPSTKAITSTMSFSGLALEQVMAPVYMISGQKLMVDTPITIGSMSPRTVIRLATSGSELVLAMSIEGPKSASATGTSTTSHGTSQGQQISTTSTTSTIGIGQMINQGLGGPTPGAPATTSVKGVEFVTKSVGTSLRYSNDKMVRIRIKLGLLSGALVMLVLM